MPYCDACERDNRVCAEHGLCFTGLADLMMWANWHVCEECKAIIGESLVGDLSREWWLTSDITYDTLSFLVSNQFLTHDEAKYTAEQLAEINNRRYKESLRSWREKPSEYWRNKE